MDSSSIRGMRYRPILPVLRILLLLCCTTIPLLGQTIHTGEITYLTSTVVYVNLGTGEGFDVGDTLHVMKRGKRTAILRVATIASKSLSADVISKEGELREGDEVRGTTYRAPKVEVTRTRTDTSAARPPPRPKENSAELQGEDSASNILHGRVALQYYAIKTSAGTELLFNQPAAVFQLSGERIFGAPLSFSFYSNSRYDMRSEELRAGVDQTRLTNRVYEAAIGYDIPQSSLQMRFGRFIVPVIGGIGTFDGLLGMMRLGDVQVGVVGGTQPGWRNSDIQLEGPKFAAFATLTRGDYSSVRYQGSMAFAQQYYAKRLDRRFIYLQNSVSFSNALSLYQNANFDLQDLVDGERRFAPHLTDFFLSASYRPARWMSASGSYSVRRNIYFLESFRNIPDSLFDRSILQNMQLSVGIRLPWTMYLTVSGALRVREGETQTARSAMLNYSWADILGSAAGMYLTGSIADNIYNQSRSLGLEMHRDVVENLYASAKANRFTYIYPVNGRTINRTTLGVDLLYRFDRTYFATLSYERYFEEILTTDRLYLELSVRF